jgi:hypothetical protein
LLAQLSHDMDGAGFRLLSFDRFPIAYDVTAP